MIHERRHPYWFDEDCMVCNKPIRVCGAMPKQFWWTDIGREFVCPHCGTNLVVEGDDIADEDGDDMSIFWLSPRGRK